MEMKDNEKQAVEEFENDLIACHAEFEDGGEIYNDYKTTAERMCAKGYRKQSEGEWIETDYKTVEYGFVERRGKAWLCTNCRHASKEFNPNMKYCPNCGAHMKGGAE
jgi:hypothetical protein